MFIYFTHQINQLKKETFIGESTITQQINQIYNADVDAIRNLSAIATQLTTGGTTVPGNLSITGVLNILPSGLVIAYTGSNDPAGWLMCDGRSLSKTTYANLFSIIGVQFGSADAATFKIPNYKGAFLRGTGSNGINIAPALNASQSDAVQNHTHHMHDPGHAHGGRTNVVDNFGVRGPLQDVSAAGKSRADYYNSHGYANRGITVDGAGTGVRCDWMRDGRTADETRPYNYGVNWIIKI
jgi:microcystin-dependent protein